MLMDSSTVQGLFTWPLMQKSLVPLLLGRPKLANQSGPRRRMVGTQLTVSTLVTAVKKCSVSQAVQRDVLCHLSAASKPPACGSGLTPEVPASCD